MHEFQRFNDETIRFLKDLSFNNNKAWFQENKERYIKHYLEPARSFVTAMSEQLKELSPTIRGVPEVGQSILRINRDVRFTKDKRPYKTCLEIWFWEGDIKGWDHSGFFFRLSADQLILGTGILEFSKPLLDNYRHAVLNESTGKRLYKLLKDYDNEPFLTCGGIHYKNMPKGWNLEDERAPLLLHNGLYAGFEMPISEQLFSERFPEYCFEKYAKLAPLHKWLMEVSG